MDLGFVIIVISRLQQVHLVVDDINNQARDLASVYEATLEPFSPHFYKLVEQFSREFDRYRLDEIVVAAIAPIVRLASFSNHAAAPNFLFYFLISQFRRMVTQWNPLEEPAAFLSTFRNWRRALKVSSNEDKPPQSQVDVYGTRTTVAVPPQM